MKDIMNLKLRILDILTSVFILGITVYLVLDWKYIPELIPKHWGWLGKIDSLGDSGMLIAEMIIMYFLWFGHLLSRFLTMFFTREDLFGKKSAGNVSDETYRKGKRYLYYMLWSIDLVLQMAFAYMIWCGTQVRNLGIWFLPVLMGIIYTAIVVGLVSIYRMGRHERA